MAVLGNKVTGVLGVGAMGGATGKKCGSTQKYQDINTDDDKDELK